MNIIILGASVRAAAYSALRAGLTPIGVDLFGDTDLRSIARTIRIDAAAYPGDFAWLVDSLPPGPWMYTGALENHPALIDSIAASRTLWGIQRSALRAVRDPYQVRDALKGAGLPHLEVTTQPTSLPSDGSWLRKPLRSASGHAIEPLLPTTHIGPHVYFQRKAEGESHAALFIGQAGEARLFGVTRQLIGREGAFYGYVGSWGPIALSKASEAILKAQGSCLASNFGLRGVFGVDFVLEDDVPLLVEVNPRYTASVEVLEWALGQSLLTAHRSVFESNAVRTSRAESPTRPFVGKAILYAHQDFVSPELAARNFRHRDALRFRGLADIPAPGTQFQKGEPIATILVRATTAEACVERLRQRSRIWERRLGNQGFEPGTTNSPTAPLK